jgi:CPA2 family monovalent cation:H+ antiporter-2
MVVAARSVQSDAKIFARAKDIAHAARLLEIGAVGVIPEAVEASLQLGGRLLETLGLPSEAVEQRLALMREQELGRLAQPQE